MALLKKNDIVSWRGSWGTQKPQDAIVTQIELCENGSKHGNEVREIDWELCNRNVVVTLDNGHWAYGNQITPK